MILTLQVTGPQAQEMGTAGRKVFKAIGGTIGRLADNDWVFPDPYVSGRHALIRYVSGKFFVEDTSTNGVFINSPDNRLSRGQPQQLRDGDLLYIDAYQINVSIQNDVAADSRNDPFASLKNGSPRIVPPPRRAPAPPPAPPAAQEDSTENLAVSHQTASLQKESRQNDRPHSTVVQNLDRDLDKDLDEDEENDEPAGHGTEWFPPPRAAVRRPPPPVAKSAPSSPSNAPPSALPLRQRSVPSDASTGADAQLRTLLDAAGIQGLEPTNETAQTLGEILRIALGGVMEALRTRERMKDDLRMRGTSFKAADNNPLKFSANVDDAFHNLLVKHNPAYLQPAAACEDAFRDVRDHQAAFLAAMRLAFESMLSQFDPQRLQEEFDRQMKGSILGVPAKLRYWDLYRDKYGELVKDAEAGFRTLFADAFARAYEEHLERLKKLGRQAGQ